MIKGLVLLVGLALAGVAQAQIKCWTDANGKRACGDLPPPGARLETPKGAPAPQAPAPAAAGTKKGTPASTPQKTAAKANLEQSQNTGDPRKCEQAKEMLRAMGGGGRSQRTDAVKARALAQNNCS